LNRAAFADRIAGVLHGLPQNTGLVIGIHGPWGDGKTTVLNLLRINLAKDNTIVIRDFNPWRITDEDSMLRGFFSVLAEAIGASLSTGLERTKAGVGKFAKFFRLFTRPIGSFWKPVETVDRVLSKLSKVIANGDSVGLEDLRDRIIMHLKQSTKRIVILIDDIDRLDKDETHMLFRLIKACADFPNVCYVLAFDDTTVAKALGEQYDGNDKPSGRAFLEKIIQVPLKLPLAAKEDLRALCFEQVDRACAAAGIKLTKDQVYEFMAGFDRGALIRLTTPRAAKRFGNGLMFAMPMLIGETNPVDLLLVEALRAFFPEVYNIVRDNHTDFSGVESDRYGNEPSDPRSGQLLHRLLEKMPKEHGNAVKALLVDLFPRLNGVFDRTIYGSDWLSRWSCERRISAPEYCPRYFTYTVLKNDIPDSEITALIDVAKKQDKALVETWMTTHFTRAKILRIIGKLRSIEATVDPNAAEVLAITIAKLGKNIPNSPALSHVAGTPMMAAILISHLLHRIPEKDRRIDVAKHVIMAVDPLWFGVECIRWLHITDKPEKQESNTLSKQETAEVRQILVNRIKTLSKTGAPLFDPNIRGEASLLFAWWRVEGRDPVQAHLVSVFIKNPKQVASFLQSQTTLAWSAGSMLPHVSDLDTDHLKNIKLIIDLDMLAKFVRNHCSGNFENPQWYSDDTKPLEQRLAEQFMYIYMKWKKDGEPPDAQSENE